MRLDAGMMGEFDVSHFKLPAGHRMENPECIPQVYSKLLLAVVSQQQVLVLGPLVRRQEC